MDFMKAIEFRIRPATEEDQAVIRQSIYKARLNPLGISWRAFVIAGGLDGCVLGCGQIKTHRDGTQELASLYIEPEFRDQGIAAALVHHLQSQARSDLWLTCRSNLIPFYKRFGFVDTTDPQKMPSYFRKVWGLFQVFKRLAGRVEYLAVMRWSGSLVNE